MAPRSPLDEGPLLRTASRAVPSSASRGGCDVIGLHTHAATVNAFSALGAPLRPLSHDAVVFAERGLPSFGATANLVHTQELGKALAADLGPARACLMPQHGLLTAVRDIAHAGMYAVLLERARAIQLTAQAAGPVRHWTDHWLGFELGTTTLWHHPTIKDLAEYLAEEVAQRAASV
ncbi:class II aldolase/adducin family protein [Kitasatospora sp. NPDC001159]